MKFKKMNRRDFLKKFTQLTVLGAFPFLYSWQIEPFWVEFVYKKMQKIELKNPQDIYHNEKDNELAIVDFDYGLIIINLSTGDAIGYRLPNDDVPNSLKFVNNFGNKFCIDFYVLFNKNIYKKLIFKEQIFFYV